MKFKHLTIAVLAVLLGIATFHFAGERKRAEAEKERTVLRAKRVAERAARREALRKERLARRGERVGQGEKTRTKANFLDPDLLEGVEETKLMRAVLEDLQKAVSGNDLPKLRSLVSRILKNPERMIGLKRIPTAMKVRMIEALGWFGADGLPDVLDVLANSMADAANAADAGGEAGDAGGEEAWEFEPEVAESVLDQIEDALWDCGLSDRERSVILSNAAKLFNDPDSLDRLLPEVYDMRHSVGIGTIVEIMHSGSAEAKAKVPELIEGFTGLDYLETEQHLQIWLEDYPDEPDDEAFYGATPTETSD